MTRPAKSIADLLRGLEERKAKANPPPEPTAFAAPEPASVAAEAMTSYNPVPQALTRNDKVAAPAMAANVDAWPSEQSANVSIAPRRPRLPPLPFNPVPPNEICGARTKRGTACQSRTLYRSGRCKNHGGMSTGPKTAEGKARVAKNACGPRKKSKVHEALIKVDIGDAEL